MPYLRSIGSAKVKRIILIILFLVSLALGWQGYRLYRKVLAPGVFLGQPSEICFVQDSTRADSLWTDLERRGWIRDRHILEILASRKGMVGMVRPGRYRLRDGMSLNALVNMFRGGLQEPLQLVIRPFRSMDELLGYLDAQLQADRMSLQLALGNDSLLHGAGLASATRLLMLVPNTYEVWWTTSAQAFAARMQKEYLSFWNEERRKKAEALGLSPARVGILASIVQEETNRRDEMATIAGVYLNRLRRGMLLQADPTVKYALGDMGLRRILTRHLEVDSPFNTYKYAGLPPGPITMPEPFVIDAVLGAESHDYLFFCASAGLDGSHVFARTHAQHARNARAYQRALNERRIFR